MKRLWRKISLLALIAASVPALAADPKPLTLQEIAGYQGADRHERLVAAARKEGELTVYHVYPALTTLTTEFSKKYGIKVKNWRAGSEAVLQRIIAEARGRKFDVDVMHNNAPEAEAAYRENLLQEMASPYLKDLLPGATPAHRGWAGITVDIYAAAYNTEKVKKEDLPKTYQDLLSPKWKGRLGVEADDHGWFGTLVETMGEQQTTKLFNDIVATNGMSVRKGHSLLAGLVASGDVPLALTVYSWTPEQLKQKGAPIEVFTLPTTVAQFSTVSVMRKAPHPAAAALFYDFLLNEGQQMLANLQFVPASKKIDSLATRTSLKYIDPVQALEKQEKWLKAYQDVMSKPR